MTVVIIIEIVIVIAWIPLVFSRKESAKKSVSILNIVFMVAAVLLFLVIILFK